MAPVAGRVWNDTVLCGVADMEVQGVGNDSGTADPRRVFVIHGRNERARKGLFEFLRSIGLSPMEWSHAIELTGHASPYIGDVLDAAFGAAQAVVVLQTPDDVAYLHPSLSNDDDDPECKAQMQPRPNVLFEAGMAMGRYPERTVIVELGKIKGFSDIHGRHIVRLNNTVAKRQDLAQRLGSAGCTVTLTGSDWHESGDLRPPDPPGGGLPLGRKHPSSTSSGPRLDAAYHVRGRDQLADVQVTNYGPGDVYELNVTVRGRTDARYVDLPIPKLPQGKSITIVRVPPASWAAINDDEDLTHFYLDVIGKTIDGTEINQELFVSTG